MKKKSSEDIIVSGKIDFRDDESAWAWHAENAECPDIVISELGFPTRQAATDNYQETERELIRFFQRINRLRNW